MTTIWLKAHDLLKEHGRTVGAPIDGRGCYCVGGAIAQVITGDPYDMEAEEYAPEVNAALHKFADHVGVLKEYDWDGETFLRSGYDRVYPWNDNTASDEDVFKALMELHEAEVAAANA